MADPEQWVGAITHVTVADAVGFSNSGPDIYHHDESDRQDERKKQNHCRAGEPAVLGGRIPPPYGTGDGCGNEAVDHCKGEVYEQIDVRAVLSESTVYAFNWHVVMVCDLSKQLSHAPVSVGGIVFTGDIVG